MARWFEIDDGEVGQRLDVFIVRQLPDLGRAKVRKLTLDGKVAVNGRRVKKSYLLETGDVVCIEEDVPTNLSAVADAGVKLTTVLERPDFVVVDKPAGVSTHPLVAEERGTLVNALVAHYPEMQGVGYSEREPGILHRLDRDTSGLVLAARTSIAFETLRQALQTGQIEKHYLALCEGEVKSGQFFDSPIANDPTDRRRSQACVDEIDISRLKAKPALTEILSAQRLGEFSLIKVRANKARRHQVRVHLSAAGHPLAGDSLYGGRSIEGLNGHFLHATELRFCDPSTQEMRCVSQALPQELQRIVDSI